MLKTTRASCGNRTTQPVNRDGRFWLGGAVIRNVDHPYIKSQSDNEASFSCLLSKWQHHGVFFSADGHHRCVARPSWLRCQPASRNCRTGTDKIGPAFSSERCQSIPKVVGRLHGLVSIEENHQASSAKGEKAHCSARLGFDQAEQERICLQNYANADQCSNISTRTYRSSDLQSPDDQYPEHSLERQKIHFSRPFNPDEKFFATSIDY